MNVILNCPCGAEVLIDNLTLTHKQDTFSKVHEYEYGFDYETLINFLLKTCPMYREVVLTR